MSVMDGVSGAAGAAGLGAKLGSFGGPLGAGIGAGVGALVGGIGGLVSAKSKRRDAEKKAQLSAKLARIDTEYSPFVGKTGYQTEAAESTPSGVGGALSGGFAGGLQGLNVYRGLNQDDLDSKKLDLLNQLSGSGKNLSNTYDAMKSWKDG